MTESLFQKVVFAGGGHRCWWQAGWYTRVRAELGLAPTRIAGVSAGASTACLLYANTPDVALDHYRSVIGPKARNAYWRNMVRPGESVFPHEAIYRHALHTLLGGDAFAQLQRDAPEMRIVYALSPRRTGAVGGFLVGMVAYNIEKHIRRPLHPVAGQRLGFEAQVSSLQACADEHALVDLLLASSATPPFTKLRREQGRGVLDGGMIDNVPVLAIDDEGERSAYDRGRHDADTLVLLTRRYDRYPDCFRYDGRIYVQPSARVPVSGWDYTAPEAYAQTYAQGESDAEQFLRMLARTGLPQQDQMKRT